MPIWRSKTAREILRKKEKEKEEITQNARDLERF